MITNVAPDRYACLALTGPRKKPSTNFAAFFVVFSFDKLLVVFLGQSVCIVRDRPEIGIKAFLGGIQTV